MLLTNKDEQHKKKLKWKIKWKKNKVLTPCYQKLCHWCAVTLKGVKLYNIATKTQKTNKNTSHIIIIFILHMCILIHHAYIHTAQLNMNNDDNFIINYHMMILTKRGARVSPVRYSSSSSNSKKFQMEKL